MAVFANPDDQIVTIGANRHIALNQEGDAAKHLFLGYVWMIAKASPDFVDKLLLVGHRSPILGCCGFDELFEALQGYRQVRLPHLGQF